MITVDVGLSARPRILNGPSVSITVDPVGLLGITGVSTRTGDTSAVVDFTADLTGGQYALAGDVSAVVDASATRKIIWLETFSGWYGYYIEDRPDMPLLYIIHEVPVAYYDTDYDPPLVDYSMSVGIQDTITVQGIPSVTIPDPPAPAPPAPPEDPGNFPMPTAGGVVVRAQYGVVVDMDEPTITNGVPSS